MTRDNIDSVIRALRRVNIQGSFFGFGKGGGAASGKRFATFTGRGYAVAEFDF